MLKRNETQLNWDIKWIYQIPAGLWVQQKKTLKSTCFSTAFSLFTSNCNFSSLTDCSISFSICCLSCSRCALCLAFRAVLRNFINALLPSWLSIYFEISSWKSEELYDWYEKDFLLFATDDVLDLARIFWSADKQEDENDNDNTNIMV